MLTIRLSRGGRVHLPIYTIVAADSRNARDGSFKEKLGQYNPSADEGKVLVNVNADRIKELVAQGATLSDTVNSLLKKHKISFK